MLHTCILHSIVKILNKTSNGEYFNVALLLSILYVSINVNNISLRFRHFLLPSRGRLGNNFESLNKHVESQDSHVDLGGETNSELPAR